MAIPGARQQLSSIRGAHLAAWAILSSAALLPQGVGAQASPAPGREPPTQDSLADPAFIEQYAATRGFSLGRPAGVALSPSGDTVLFLRSGPRSFVRDLYAFDTATAKPRLLLSADSILKGGAEQLTAEEYFLNSLKISDALFRAGISHEFRPLAGQTHMVADPTFSRQVNATIVEFFVRYLGPR